MRTGVVSSITLIKEIEPGLHQCEVIVDDFDSYTLFGNYTEYLPFIGNSIEFSTRKDIVNGVVTEVINTVAEKSIVQSAEVSKDILSSDNYFKSIIPNKSKTVEVVTFDSKSLKSGDIARSQIVLVFDVKNGKSNIAKWKDFKCLDKMSKSFNLRVFTNDDSIDEFCQEVIGKYMLVDIKNTQYGLQVLDGTEFSIYYQNIVVPPEVTLSVELLRSVMENDEDLINYEKKYNLIENLQNIIYFEIGYHLVEMAAEVIMINSICKIFEGYDRKTLIRAVFATRGYLMQTNTGVRLSNPMINYHRLLTSTLKNDLKLAELIDFAGNVEEGDIDKAAYLNIRRFVTNIMKGRRGLNEENHLSVVIDNLNAEYGGLFSRGFELD